MVKLNNHAKIVQLTAEVQVRDKIIGGLMHIVAEKKISLPAYLLSVIELLYFNKLNKNKGDTNGRNNKNPGDNSDTPSAGHETEEKEKEKEKH